MALTRKPGITCKAHGTPKSDQGTNCRSCSPSLGVIDAFTTYWTEASSAGRKLVEEVEFLWARLFNATKAAAFASAHAKPHPAGLCARYSTAAVTAGFGVDESKITSLLGINGASAKFVQFLIVRLALNKIVTPESAKDYGTKVLLPLGFRAIAVLQANKTREEIEVPIGYKPATGDVIIFPANPQAGNKDGHMQICTGDPSPEKQWVSDSHQKSILPNNTLTLGWQKVGFVAYRFESENLLFKPIAAH